MRFKDGVNPFGCTPELMLGLFVVDAVFIAEAGREATITSMNDGRHSQSSLHYAGNAADIRVRNPVPESSPDYWEIPINQRMPLVQKIKAALGRNPDYDVVLEADHIHIEYQPKFRGSQ